LRFCFMSGCPTSVANLAATSSLLSQNRPPGGDRGKVRYVREVE
jgi:hypothetical protein